MSRRNGESLAWAVAAGIRSQAEAIPGRSAAEYWEQVLEKRPGWRRLRQDLFEFRTGERLELDSKAGPSGWIAQMARIELKSLGQGLSSEVQQVLLEEGVASAQSWWNQQGA